MSQTQILVLGAIAGLTIFIGLPVGRVGRMSVGTSAFLAATATGILLFLLWDVLSAGIEPVESALTAARFDHTGGWGLRMAGHDLRHWIRRRPHEPRLLRRADRPQTQQQFQSVERGRRDRGRRRSGAGLVLLSPAQSLSLMIATGIGLHNFSEGLAIGQSAAAGRSASR